MKPRTLDTLRAMLYDLKMDALWAGRYPPPRDVSAFERRDKSKAFRCINYNRVVRQIGALTDVIKELEKTKP